MCSSPELFRGKKIKKVKFEIWSMVIQNKKKSLPSGKLRCEFKSYQVLCGSDSINKWRSVMNDNE